MSTRGSYYFDKIRHPEQYSNNRAWSNRWVEYDAESRNYLAKTFYDQLMFNDIFKKLVLKSDKDAVQERLLRRLKQELKGNGWDPRINPDIVEYNNTELVNMTERVADRIIEVAEEFNILWYKDNAPPNYNKPLNRFNIPDAKKWLEGKSVSYNWVSSFGDYFRFLHDKAIGEI